MTFSLKLSANRTKQIVRKRINGERNFPAVMMLEPPMPACENGSFNIL